jgi:hypothetical protein
MKHELPTRDWCNVEGAKALARIITAYWAKRGYVVNVQVQSQGRETWTQNTIGIRSDMLNGLPRHKINKAVRL